MDQEFATSFLYFSVPLIVSVFMLYLTASQVHIKRTERREQELRILNDMIFKERHIYSEKALELYKKHYKDDDAVCKKMIGKKNKWDCHIVSKYKWMAEYKEDMVIPLKKIKINYDPDVWSTDNNLKMRLQYSVGSTGVKLPFNKLSFTENVKALSGRYIPNEFIYGLTGVKVNEEGMTLDVNMGKFSDAFDTCDFMTYEISHRLHYGRKLPKDMSLSDFPYRSRMDPFLMKNRFAGIRVCTLTILKNFEGEDRTVFLMQRRMSKVNEGTEVFNVVPAGSYKPIFIENVSDPDAEGTKKINIDPINTVIREFLEEVADNESYENLSSKKILLQKRREIYADIFFLGVGFEPLNLRAELLTCMVVDVQMSHIFEGHMTYEGFKEHLAKTFGGTVIMRDFTVHDLEQYSDNLRSVPACREILEFAVDHHEELCDMKVTNNMNS